MAVIFELLMKVVIIVVATNGFRWIAEKFGPTVGGYVLALPCSTAIVLIFYANEHGTDSAIVAAQNGILGVVSAVIFALVFSYLLSQETRLAISMIIASGGFVAASAVIHALSVPSIHIRTVASVLGVMIATRLADLLPTPELKTKGCRMPAWNKIFIRTFIASAAILGINGIQNLLSEQWAGLLSTYPCTFVAVLTVTFVECGRADAIRLAKAFPAGNFGMIGFIVSFGGIPSDVGPVTRVITAYAVALAVVLLIQARKFIVRLTIELFRPKPATNLGLTHSVIEKESKHSYVSSATT